MNLGTGGIEVLVLQFALETAVHRICKIGTERLYVEVIHSAPNLLVGSEGDADFAVPHLGMFDKVFGCGHYLRDTGLVVCPQKRRTVGVNQSMPLEKR